MIVSKILSVLVEKLSPLKQMVAIAGIPSKELI